MKPITPQASTDDAWLDDIFHRYVGLKERDTGEPSYGKSLTIKVKGIAGWPEAKAAILYHLAEREARARIDELGMYESERWSNGIGGAADLTGYYIKRQRELQAQLRASSAGASAGATEQAKK